MRGDARIEIGGIARAHGIKGEVVVVTHDPDSETLGKITSIWIEGTEYKITGARDTQRGWLVALEGIVTRNDAERLQGKQIEVERSSLELDEEDVLLDDMVGCEVRLPDGTPWGTVVAIDISNPHQDLLVVHDGDTERLLPIIDQFVTNVDLDAGIVMVDPPEGLPSSKVPK
ncbi:MAG TPA: ribosome maturation factor RimM [Kofleriaceae bacterium]|nr:ribosome maturation factor RimM [Kofleriaceae bacterium]